jgi:hypothetical protein
MAVNNRLQASAHQKGPFRAHGDATVSVEGRVMHFAATGPWNLEFIEALWRVMVKAASQLPQDGRFVDLVEVRGSAWMTPDALQLLSHCIDTAVAQGFRASATALVIPMEVEGRSLMLPKLVEVYGRHRPVLVHTDAAQARAALRALMPDLDLAESGP